MSLSDKIDYDLLSNYGDVIATELAEALKKNIDFFQAVCAVGQIAPILIGLPGVPLPNENIWQECNGSEIINPNSPLRSQGNEKRFVPDMRDRYILSTKSGGQTAGESGGENHTYYFTHNHTGYTEIIHPQGNTRGGGAVREPGDHGHSVATEFPYGVNIEPPFYTVKYFMRIQ